MKLKIRTWRFCVEKTDMVYVPSMEQIYLFGVEFFGQLPHCVKRYRLVSSNHEIITDWLPLSYKAEIIHTCKMNELVKIEFEIEHHLALDSVSFTIEAIFKLGYEK